MKFNILTLLTFCLAGGRQWLGWGAGFGFAFFNSRSSSRSETKNITETNTETSTVGADNGAIAARDSNINILDGGAINSAFDFSEKSITETGKNFKGLLDAAKSLFNTAVNSNNKILKDSVTGIKTVASESITKANERPGENPTKWILGAAALVGVAMVIKK